MSYLNVTNVSHTFGGRQILENVSFKLLRGEHVGLVGATAKGNRPSLISLPAIYCRMKAR